MITVYTSPTCGKCKILKKKLEQKGLAYEECQDVTEMESLGIENLPGMAVDGVLMTFEEAVKFVNER